MQLWPQEVAEEGKAVGEQGVKGEEAILINVPIVIERVTNESSASISLGPHQIGNPEL